MTSSFEQFLNNLLNNPSTETTISINGTVKKIRGMAEFKTVNMGEDSYIKIVFDDHSFLLIIPSEEALYYADEVIGLAEEVSDEMIGQVEVLEYKGRKYTLANKDDFQYTVRLYVGGPDDIEGECKFSDYVPLDDPDSEILSLGWLCRTGERADINPKRLPAEQVTIANYKP